MKYKAPEGCAGISVGGEQFNVDENGLIEVPDGGDYGQLLAPHGFVIAPVVEEVAAKPTAKKAKAAAPVVDATPVVEEVVIPAAE